MAKESRGSVNRAHGGNGEVNVAGQPTRVVCLDQAPELGARGVESRSLGPWW